MTDRAFHYVELGYNKTAAAYNLLDSTLQSNDTLKTLLLLLAALLLSLKVYSFAFYINYRDTHKRESEN
jgi:hypothetical protein